MKKFDKRKNRGIEQVPEEDVAKALLNKKTEVALYKNVKPLEDTPELTETQKIVVQEEMMSALDLLRKERGQKSIAQEEFEYSLENDSFEQPEEDDFTSVTLNQGDLSRKLVQEALYQKEVEEKKEEPKVERKPKKEKKKKVKKEKVKKEKKPKKEKKSKPASHKKPMSKVTKVILCLVLLGVALMGGYAYKFYIYDPQNIATQEQLDAYDRLISYADEYDMMSDSEKLELLDMTKDYDSLLDKQKSKINDYFKDENHVGKTYSKLIKELEKLKTDLEDESAEGFQTLKAYLEGWSTYGQDTKKTIINYKATYDNLNSTLQKKIDDIARTNCTKSYTALYDEYHEIVKQENQVQIEENETQIAELQAQLNTEQATLNDYKTYGESLQNQLQSAQEREEDTTAIQSQIDTNNASIATSQQTVDQLQAQINALEAQNEQLRSV